MWSQSLKSWTFIGTNTLQCLNTDGPVQLLSGTRDNLSEDILNDVKMV